MRKVDVTFEWMDEAGNLCVAVHRGQPTSRLTVLYDMLSQAAETLGGTPCQMIAYPCKGESTESLGPRFRTGRINWYDDKG